ncbi:cell division topological specificity factor MinE [Pseudanabaena yagii GIHE-NHR1]|uniref:Cell division topological specificity factor n=1 Tax=Pseudanabaena yagii GIHE-NHR1 TaxID=2722753 RepID=A0ABX1LLC4_9CYAN|nr:cell division topological specificity factor MinE [Pseudanabaena yagii]NMF56914.1 cell division topological specificity factor MinE [Pseudanabaena yagii GIHE-NHR1]
MISTLLDRLFQRQNVTSGTQVKQRLKFILAHDRAAIEPQVFDNMRHEIMRVVSKYVELDEGSLDIRLESDKRMTALIANLPIRMVREELPDLVALFDETSQETNSEQTDPLALEMDQFADEALDAIAAKENTKLAPENSSLENTTELAERTTEVANKLRNAANKSQKQNLEIDAPIADIPKEQVTSNASDLVESSIINEPEQLEEQASDQLELSFNLTDSEESSETSNQVSE